MFSAFFCLPTLRISLSSPYQLCAAMQLHASLFLFRFTCKYQKMVRCGHLIKLSLPDRGLFHVHVQLFLYKSRGFSFRTEFAMVNCLLILLCW
jgi:hypothetical protein